jgi:hypothetical protein
LLPLDGALCLWLTHPTHIIDNVAYLTICQTALFAALLGAIDIGLKFSFAFHKNIAERHGSPSALDRGGSANGGFNHRQKKIIQDLVDTLSEPTRSIGDSSLDISRN